MSDTTVLKDFLQCKTAVSCFRMFTKLEKDNFVKIQYPTEENNSKKIFKHDLNINAMCNDKQIYLDKQY